MHELSIAMSIVDIVEDYAKKANAKEVKQLVLEIGTQAGVVEEALNFAIEEAFKNTVLHHAKTLVHTVQAVAKCDACKHEFEVEELFTPCPECGQIRNELIKGKELNVKKIIVD